MSEAEALVKTPEELAREIYFATLTEISSFFPVTERDMELAKFAQSLNQTRRLKGEGRQQITVVRCVDGTIRHGSQTEEEELEVKSDPDAQFTSSWIDALQHANDDNDNPKRITEVVTQRWVEEGGGLRVVSPDSIARMQYIQFSPGVNFLVYLGGKLVKLPAEVMYPWDFCPRQLPSNLLQQRPDWPFREEVQQALFTMITRVAGLFPFTDEDYVLMDMSKLEIRKRFVYGFWQFASAFVTDGGHYKAAFQTDTKSGRANTDAEQSAIKKSRRHFPEERIKTIVTAHHATKNHPHDGDGIDFVMSCALCRKSLLRHNPNMMEIVPLNGHGIGKVPIWLMYPLPDFALLAPAYEVLQQLFAPIDHSPDR